jgi:hypothetical protein
MVVQVADTFSAAIVLSSFMTVSEDAPVTLLMDVSELRKRYGFGEVLSGQKQKTNELDELDGVGGNLGPDERRELEQLERWKGNPEGQPPSEQPPADQPLPAAPSPDGLPAAEEPQMPSPEALTSPAADLPPPAPDTMPPPPETANPPVPAPGDPGAKDTQDLDRLLDQ